jgi:phosphopantothenoylcysteine decarboxylase
MLTTEQTSILRALSPTIPTFVFPAMNTLMYEHPLTEQHLRTVREVLGYTVIGPISKTLACGDVGMPSGSLIKSLI